MFYSHEILTSRKHGVATVWLVATLGSKSSPKRVTRKAILDVDVPKACETIVDPSAPMALRLQGNLLYGVSRVYSQQCSYVLSDLQNFRDKMRGLAAILKEVEMDPEVGKARADQLNLPDDPAFFPDLDMGFDLSPFDISTEGSLTSGILSPFALASSQSSHQPNLEGEHEPQLVFPSDDTPSAGFGAGFGFGGDTSSARKTGDNMGHLSIFDDSAVNENPDFDFDVDGNILELLPQNKRQSAAPSATGAGGQLESDTGISARVRAEHEGGAIFDQANQDFNFDDGIIAMGDDDPILPPAFQFSPARHEETTASEEARQSLSAYPEEEHSSSIDAKQGRIKPVKPLLIDQRTELSNKELSGWNTNYLANMAEATRHKEQHKALAQGKKNASFWVLQQGIGGVEAAFGQDRVLHPLSIFSGQALLDALTGCESSPAGTKRSRSSADEEEDEEEARRVRARGQDEEQIGNDDDDGIIVGDDMPPSEVGRNAPPSLPDHSSQMPWNISGSRHSSVRPMGSGLLGAISSSFGSLAGRFELGPASSLARRRSRFTSASPLQGKSLHLPRLSKISSLEILSDPQLPRGGGNFEDEGMPLPGDIEENEEFQLYGPAAAVDTQTAAQSQWVAATLENEAHNFLLFLDKEIQERGGREHEMGEEGTGTITLDELLPSAQNNNVVAAQALLHILALTTKGLIQVKQEEPFGDITIGVVGGLVEEEAEFEEDHPE